MKARQLFMATAIACTMSFAANAQAHDMQGGMDHHMMGPGAACMQSLPADKEQMAHETMHRAMEKDRPLFERSRKLHDKMMAIGTSDKFSKADFMKVSDEMANLHMTMERHHTEAMASIAEKLSGAERREIAKCMEDSFHHGEPHHDGERGGMMNSHNDYSNLNK